MSNVFNASFDELLAQAGVNTGTPEKPVEEKTFDEVVADAGIEKVETPEDITEEYRVSTDIFGDNDKPKELGVPSFDDLMNAAGATETTKANEKPQEPVAPNATVSFDDLLANAPTIESPKAEEKVVENVPEQTTPEPDTKEKPVETNSEKSKVENAPKQTKQVETVEAELEQTKKAPKKKAKKAKQPDEKIVTQSDALLDEETVLEIKQEIRQVVRDAVRESFKEAITDLVKAFK